MRMLVLSFLAFFLSAAVEIEMDCGTLGYADDSTEWTDCAEGALITCPSDLGYKVCTKLKSEYTLSACPDGAECEREPRYRLEDCQDGYTLSADGESCVANSACSEGWGAVRPTCPAHQIVQEQQQNGTTCYQCDCMYNDESQCSERDDTIYTCEEDSNSCWYAVCQDGYTSFEDNEEALKDMISSCEDQPDSLAVYSSPSYCYKCVTIECDPGYYILSSGELDGCDLGYDYQENNSFCAKCAAESSGETDETPDEDDAECNNSYSWCKTYAIEGDINSDCIEEFERCEE